MNWQLRRLMILVVLIVAVSVSPLRSQEARGKFLAPSTQVVVIRAGRLFDSKSGNMLTNQIVLIKGDRVTDVGPGVQIPAGARVIDLSSATVMPGHDRHARPLEYRRRNAGLTRSSRSPTRRPISMRASPRST